MRISIDIELRDVPGELLRALEPIANYGGNIVSIVHLREEKRDKVPVHLIFEIDSQEKLKNILEEYEKRNISVLKVGEAKRRIVITVGIIGHIIDTDLMDTIDRINDIEGALVEDLSLRMSDPEKESSAIFKIVLNDENVKEKFFERLYEIAREKNLLIIKSISD